MGLLLGCLLAGMAWGTGAPTAAAPAAPRLLRGEEAIRALGTRLPSVARAHRRSPDQLALQFRIDPTLAVEPGGHLLHSDPVPEALLPPSAGSGTSFPVPLVDTFRLHSRPGSSRIIYLDFDGHLISGTVWNAYYFSGQDLLAPAFDIDGHPESFNDEERRRIQEIWARVSEDYAPFDVDVTTELSSEDQIRRTNASDSEFGTRVLISPISSYFGDYGGMAWVGLFASIENSHSYFQPALVFPERLNGASPKYVAESVSHEAGHTLGLSHDGTSSETYYEGHGSGETAWTPIMGTGYYRNLSQWSRGEYPGANNGEDDIAVIQRNGLSLRPDDHGNEPATGTRLPSGGRFEVDGVLETGTDADVLTFDVDAGFVRISVLPVRLGPNVDLIAELRDATGTLVLADNPADSLGASLLVEVPAGTYSLTVRGAGRSANGNDFGYSSYGCAGFYFVRGNTGGAPPTPPVAFSQSVRTDEDAAATIMLSGSDSEGAALTYTVVTPPSRGSLSGAAPHLVYTPAPNSSGSDTFSFRVANGRQESEEAWVAIEIVPVDNVPTASPQTLVTDEEVALPIRLAGIDPDGADLTYTVVRLPVKGVLGGTAPDLVYTPNINETGIDTFTFRVGDGTHDSAEVEVVIEIRPINDIPGAVSKTVRTEEDQPVAVLLSGWDVENEALNYLVVMQPTHGVLSGVPPNLVYTPAPDFSGSDSFTYQVNDGTAESAEALVGIEIMPVNDVPVARITFTPQVGEAPLSVVFDGAGSWDAEGPLAGLVWNFGDGTTGTDVVASHTYTEPGTYGILLTVTDPQGATGVARGVVEVSPNPSQLLCVRAIDLTIVPGPRGNSVVATVRVTDRNGRVQPGVTVAGTFSGRIPRTVAAKTDSEGVAVLTSSARKLPGVTVFRLGALTKRGFVHDPTLDLLEEQAITVPVWMLGAELRERD